MGGGGQSETGVREKRGGGSWGSNCLLYFPPALTLETLVFLFFVQLQRAYYKRREKAPPTEEGEVGGGDFGI